MRKKIVPLSSSQLAREVWAEDLYYQTNVRGMDLLTTTLLNKGSAFTAEERNAFGLTGLLPPVISTLDIQAQCVYAEYLRLPDALSKSLYLTGIQNCNEVLFFRVLAAHLGEMIPIINDRTARVAMQRYRPECRHPRGVYLSSAHPEAIETAFANLGAGPDDIDLILATDAEQISGIGDWGVGGIEAATGKLAICTAAGGIDPSRVLPVMLDVGTNRESLLNDPLYSGNRHPRIRGEHYDAFIDAYVTTAARLFPNAILQWENFEPGNGRRILKKYRGRLQTFNDDLQGTGAITFAAAVSAMRVCGTALRNQRIVIFGAGTAGVGIADLLRDLMIREGLPAKYATRRFWCVDRQGLLTENMADRLPDYQAEYARPDAEVERWAREDGMIGLAEVIRQVQPTMLVGASGTAGAFTEPMIREMARHTERPIIFPLSSPAPLAEATPADLIAWTDGRALVASGSPFAPVTHKGISHLFGQLNNAMLYPGLALGAIVSQSRLVSVGMLSAAAEALSSLIAVRVPGASLLPHIDDLRSVTVTVAIAVVEAAISEGLAGVELTDIGHDVQRAMWQPTYRRILPC